MGLGAHGRTTGEVVYDVGALVGWGWELMVERLVR